MSKPGWGRTATSGGAPPSTCVESIVGSSSPTPTYLTVMPVFSVNASSTCWKASPSPPLAPHLAITTIDPGAATSTSTVSVTTLVTVSPATSTSTIDDRRLDDGYCLRGRTVAAARGRQQRHHAHQSDQTSKSSFHPFLLLLLFHIGHDALSSRVLNDRLLLGTVNLNREPRIMQRLTSQELCVVSMRLRHRRTPLRGRRWRLPSPR